MTAAESGRLFMFRLDPDLERSARWGAGQGLALPGADDGYLWHSLLKAAFDELAPKPFRIIEPGRGKPYLVGYGRTDGAAMRAHAETFADPAVSEALNIPAMASKPMPESFAQGKRLGFEVRLRPTVRQTRDGDRDRKREIDVFLQVAARDPAAPKPDRFTVYRDWLSQRLEGGGAKLIDAKLIAQRRAQILRRGCTDENGRRRLGIHGAKGGGPDVILAGELAVVDPGAFAALIARGVGRHCAFGFGMLLLKPFGVRI